jgi:uncharacterized protein YegL
MRRLPIYVLVDTSGSMQGEAIASVNVGLDALISYLRKDPHALESAWISILTYDQNLNCILPLTDIGEARIPEIEIQGTGPGHLGKALESLLARVDEELILTTSENKGDWLPVLFIMTDGCPTDIFHYRQMQKEVNNRRFSAVIACAVGPIASKEYLNELTDEVIPLETTDSTSFNKYIKWVSEIVASKSEGRQSTTSSILPPPPDEKYSII